MVRWNAAAAFVVAGRATSLEEGMALADETLDSGRAHDLLAKLRELTWKL